MLSGWCILATTGQLLPNSWPFVVRQFPALAFGTYLLWALYKTLPTSQAQLFATSPPPNYLIWVGSWLFGNESTESRWADVRFALLLAGVVGLQYGFLLNIETLQVIGSDAAAFHYPLEAHTGRAISANSLPYWNPYMFAGMPQLANMQAAPFYPITALLRLFMPAHAVINLAVLLHVYIAGLGMYWLARHYGLMRVIAFLVGLGYMLGGGVTLRVLAGHTNLLYCAAWLPVAWVLLRHVLRGNGLAITGLSVVVALLVMAGHPTWTVYGLLWLGFYTIGGWWFGAQNW